MNFIIRFLIFVHSQNLAFADGGCLRCQDFERTLTTVKTRVVKSSFADVQSNLQLTCFSQSEDKNAISVMQKMRIAAPLAQVAEVLDDFPGYAELFPELVKVEARQTGALQTDVIWTEEAPVFFMKNPVHTLAYTTEVDGSARKFYRYKLKKSAQLKYSEGLIVLLADGEKATLFLEIDFYNADWSLLKILGSNKIWSENVRQLALSDVAVRLKAETPSLSGKEVRQQSQELWHKSATESCLSSKQPYSQQAVLDNLHLSAETSKSL